MLRYGAIGAAGVAAGGLLYMKTRPAFVGDAMHPAHTTQLSTRSAQVHLISSASASAASGSGQRPHFLT